MGVQTVFKRYELKYIITREQKERILAAAGQYLLPDTWGRSTVRNIYFDTDTYLLIRRSIEHPVYKEKLRMRSYATAAGEDTVFVELKKKYRHVVYKRRLPLPLGAAMEAVCGRVPFPRDTQIARELAYAVDHYGTLHPTVFLSYDREAFYAADGTDFRVTFDERILARCEDISLGAEPGGTPLLDEGQVLMELKCAGGMPLWISHLLTRERIFKTSFSKYGAAYARLIFPKRST